MWQMKSYQNWSALLVLSPIVVYIVDPNTIAPVLEAWLIVAFLTDAYDIMQYSIKCVTHGSSISVCTYNDI